MEQKKSINIMKKKRLLFCLTVLTVLLGVIAAGRRREQASEGKAASQSTEAMDNQKKADHIVMTFQTMDDSRTDNLDRVVQAINDISREKIGVEIELKLVDAVASRKSYPLWITQGKTVDLMVLNYEDITSYVDQSMLLGLNGLLEENGKEITRISQEQRNLFTGGRVKGEIFGINVPGFSYGTCGGLWVAKKALDELDFAYDENHIYSFEELDRLFARMKEKHPKSYPLGLAPQAYEFSVSAFFLNGYDSLGVSINSGVVMEEESKRVVNFFETKDYVDWLKWMRKWYLDGYIYTDAAVTTSHGESLFKDGITMSIPQSGTPFFYSRETLGEDVVCLRLTPVEYRLSDDNSTGVFWTIPATAGKPEAAMRFLNLMYSDQDIVNLFKWGIEGEDYVFKEGTAVIFPEGKDSTTVGYYNPLGLYGNQMLCYPFESEEKKKKQEEFARQAKPVGEAYSGFIFDSSKVSVELSQIQNVLNRYLDVLETGSVDPQNVYPEFLRELEEAGISRVIQEKQRQLDEWLSQSDF